MSTIGLTSYVTSPDLWSLWHIVADPRSQICSLGCTEIDMGRRVYLRIASNLMERRMFGDHKIRLRDGRTEIGKLIICFSCGRNDGLGLGVRNGRVSALEIGIEIHGCY